MLTHMVINAMSVDFFLITSPCFENTISNLLKKAFDGYGSDKGNHGYHLIYGQVLSKMNWQEPMNILEIGLGTNNPKLISNMSIHGKPGASLRAFRDVVPKCDTHLN